MPLGYKMKIISSNYTSYRRFDRYDRSLNRLKLIDVITPSQKPAYCIVGRYYIDQDVLNADAKNFLPQRRLVEGTMNTNAERITM